MNTVIDHSQIYSPNLFTHIYGYGAHAKDIDKRGLFVDGEKGSEAHFFTLYISIIKWAISELLKTGHNQWNIVSLSGIMAEAPNGVPAAHFLFGPWATWTDASPLKVVFSNTSPDSPLVTRLKERAQQKSLKIIETSRIEHDQKMAFTQWLMHLWIILAWQVAPTVVQADIINPWKTPVQTVIEMIHLNPFAEWAIMAFFDEVWRHNYDLGSALMALIEKNLTDTNLADFGTPNSHRVLTYLQHHPGKLIISREQIEEARMHLNNDGFIFLRDTIEKIRPTNPKA